MNDLMKLEIDEIDASSRMRSIDPAQVEAIKTGILDVGLINPITVCRTDDGYKLVAGGHRLEAFRAIGYDEIPAHVVELTDLEMTIAECDENLCGTRLTPAEEAMFLAKRKEAYEAIHGPAKANSARGANASMGRGDVTEKFSVTFSADTATKTNQTERAVRMKAERGERIVPEALEAIKRTELDKGSYLDNLKRVAPEKQVETVKRDLAQPKPAPKPKPEQPAAPPATLERFVGLVDQIEALPIPSLISATPQRQRALLSQRASGLAYRMDELREALEQ